MQLDNNQIKLTEKGFLCARNIAMTLDPALKSGKVYSKRYDFVLKMSHRVSQRSTELHRDKEMFMMYFKFELFKDSNPSNF